MSWLGDIFQGATDFLLPGTGIGKLFEGVTGKQSQDPGFGVDGIFSNPQGAWDKFKNGQTNDVNKAIADENLQYQRERNEIEDARYEEETAYNRAFAEEDRDYQRRFAEEERDYQRALQQEIFNREDTALERQASSLSAMGINPASQNMSGLGAGQALSSPAPTAGTAPSASGRGGTALHNDFQMQDLGVLGAITPLMSMFNTIDNINTAGLQRDGLREQNDYQRLINQEKEIELRFKEIRLQKELEDLSANTENTKANTENTKLFSKGKEIQNERDTRVLDFQKMMNLNDMLSNKITDPAYVAEQIKTSIEGKNENGYSNNPFVYTGQKFKKSAEIVGNALNNTIGEGARAVFNFFRNHSSKRPQFNNYNSKVYNRH